MTKSHHSSDRETFGQGMANIAAGLIGGVTTATATMRTVANIKFSGTAPGKRLGEPPNEYEWTYSSFRD